MQLTQLHTLSVMFTQTTAAVLTLLLDDLLQAVEGTLVVPLRPRLLRLHLQPTAHGVERVRRVTRSDGRGLGDGELGSHPLDAGVVLEGVLSRTRVVKAKVHTTVPAFYLWWGHMGIWRFDMSAGDTDIMRWVVQVVHAATSMCVLVYWRPKMFPNGERQPSSVWRSN